MKNMVVALSCALSLCCLSAGCRTRPAADPASPPANDAGAEHSHGTGPHGGVIADWGGGEYHVEFSMDHANQTATVHILDGNAKALAPIRADKLVLSVNEPSLQLDLLPQPMESDPEGTSSRFAGSHEAFATERSFAGTILGEVDGTPFAGDFDEDADHPAH